MLGWSRDTDREVAFARAFDLPPVPAGLLARLYAAKGRMLSYDALIDAVAFAPGRKDRNGDTDDLSVIKVTIHKLRRRLGAETIATIWARGFCLTEVGRELCDEAVAKFGPPA